MSVCVYVRVCVCMSMSWCTNSTIISKSEGTNVWILFFCISVDAGGVFAINVIQRKICAHTFFLIFSTFLLFSSFLLLYTWIHGVGIHCHFPFATSFSFIRLSIAYRQFRQASILWMMLLIRVDVFGTAILMLLWLKVTFMIIFFAFYFSLAFHSHLMEILSSGNLTEPHRIQYF